MFVAGQQIHVPTKTCSKAFPLLGGIGPVGKKNFQFHQCCQSAKPRSLILNRVTGKNSKAHN